jgi:hypothetical protein
MNYLQTVIPGPKVAHSKLRLEQGRGLLKFSAAWKPHARREIRRERNHSRPSYRQAPLWDYGDDGQDPSGIVRGPLRYPNQTISLASPQF